MWTGMLLCAGLGTRLRPLTDHVPKPLAPVVERPLAHFAAQQLVAAGAAELRLNAFHLASRVEAFARELADEFSIRVSCHVEEELLGTGGGIAALRCEHTSVVWNGDIFAPDLRLNWVTESKVELPTLVVAPVRQGARGTLGVDGGGDVVRIRGERFGTEDRAYDYMGIALLPARFTALLPRTGCLIDDGLLPWLRAGNRVRTHVFDGYWSDGGTLEDYLFQNRYWLNRTGRASHRGEGARCDPGIELRETVVGRGAVVLGQGLVERSVVLPFAQATAPLKDAVVLPDGRVLQAGSKG